MRHYGSYELHRQARRLRAEELGRIAREVLVKWKALLKANHAPHPRQVSTPSHP